MLQPRPKLYKPIRVLKRIEKMYREQFLEHCCSFSAQTKILFLRIAKNKLGKNERNIVTPTMLEIFEALTSKTQMTESIDNFAKKWFANPGI